MSESPLPKIYVYRPHKQLVDAEGIAYAEDGEVLGRHISSAYGWFKVDMGLSCRCYHHAKYEEKYPGGFELVEVIGEEELRKHIKMEWEEVDVESLDQLVEPKGKQWTGTPIFKRPAHVFKEQFSRVFHRDKPGRIVAVFYGEDHDKNAIEFCRLHGEPSGHGKETVSDK